MCARVHVDVFLGLATSDDDLAWQDRRVGSGCDQRLS